MAEIPSGIICYWPGAHSAIAGMSGWSRETALDGKYGKGRASGNAGNGGNTTHNHDSSAHLHGGASHSHSVNSGSNTTNYHSWGYHPNNHRAFGATIHTHSGTTTNVAGSSSANTTPTWDSPTTDPVYYEMIALVSDGTPSGFPDDSVVYYNSASAPTDWTNFAGSRSKFIKSPSSSTGDGGADAGGGHTHSGSSHTHPGGATHDHAGGNFSGTVQNYAATGTGCDCGGVYAIPNNVNHIHNWDTDAGAGGSAGGTTSPASASTTYQPPYHTLLGIQNTSGADNWLEEAIVLWLGAAGSPPDDWTLCNGGNNDSGNATPSLDGKYILCAVSGGSDNGNTGGAAGHDHSNPGTHTHTQSHSHTAPSTGATTAPGGITGGTNSASRANYATHHAHFGSSTNSNNVNALFAVTPSTSAYSAATQAINSQANTEPAYRTVAYLSAPEEPSAGGFGIIGANF